MATVTSGGSYQRHCDCYSVTGICQADADTASGCQTRSRSYQQPDCDAGPGPASVPICQLVTVPVPVPGLPPSTAFSALPFQSRAWVSNASATACSRCHSTTWQNRRRIDAFRRQPAAPAARV